MGDSYNVVDKDDICRSRLCESTVSKLHDHFNALANDTIIL